MVVADSSRKSTLQGIVLFGCWLFSAKGYIVGRGAIRVQHPLWSDKFRGARISA